MIRGEEKLGDGEFVHIFYRQRKKGFHGEVHGVKGDGVTVTPHLRQSLKRWGQRRLDRLKPVNEVFEWQVEAMADHALRVFEVAVWCEFR